MNLMMNKDGSS